MSASGTHNPPEFKHAEDMEWEMGRFSNVTKFLFQRPERPTEPNAGFLKYAPGASFPLHRHDFAQVWYIIEGEFTFAGKLYGPGTIAYMPDPHFEALIPRDLRAEVPERIDAAGRVLTPLDETAVRREVHRLRERGAEALVIHFIHAHANPAHEQRCGEIAREIWPNRFVTLGSDILREVREFERGSTAALNGYVQPIVSRYLGRLSQNLRSGGLSNELLVMQGNGGMMAASTAADLAVHTVMSGPAAGAIAAARIGVQAGYLNLVACDMGGTSFDVSLIAAGEPALSAEKDIAYGVPLRVPLVDIHTIGAGGGSIARITRAGLLQIGPESAGARPGPIAYGRGGAAVTVTDANLVLGRLDPDRLTGVADAAPMDAIASRSARRLISMRSLPRRRYWP